MTDRADILDAVVVGAGWAGLGASHALMRQGLRHQVLERGRIGETWRAQRWNSFRMNTPNAQTVMPGDRYGGSDPDGVLARDEFVAMLEDYARRNALPVQTNAPVTELAGEEGNAVYRIATPRGSLWARNVVIASGNLNCPMRPSWAAALPDKIRQIDASGYRSAEDLESGAVLVVGSGQSGGQIAEDLAEAGRTVFLATSHVGRVPRRYRGQDIVSWLVPSGLFHLPRKDFIQPSGKIMGRPLLGALHTISLQSLSAQGVVLLGRFTGLDSGGRLAFADDLEENISFADEGSANAKRHIDAYIERTGTEAPAPEPDPAETVAARLPEPPIRSLDIDGSGIRTVIWCTGFRGDFSWVRLADVLDPYGQPALEDGLSALPGIYFVGMDLARTRGSGTILAIAGEASRLVELIAARTPP